jgi:hypothetical protein
MKQGWTKKQWLFRNEFVKKTPAGKFLEVTEEEAIRDTIEAILERVWRLADDENSVIVLDFDMLEDLGLRDEYINWGSLEIDGMKKNEDGTWEVTITGAYSLLFTDWLTSELKRCGWDNVRISCEG